MPTIRSIANRIGLGTLSGISCWLLAFAIISLGLILRGPYTLEALASLTCRSIVYILLGWIALLNVTFHSPTSVKSRTAQLALLAVGFVLLINFEPSDVAEFVVPLLLFYSVVWCCAPIWGIAISLRHDEKETAPGPAPSVNLRLFTMTGGLSLLFAAVLISPHIAHSFQHIDEDAYFCFGLGMIALLAWWQKASSNGNPLTLMLIVIAAISVLFWGYQIVFQNYFGGMPLLDIVHVLGEEGLVFFVGSQIVFAFANWLGDRVVTLPTTQTNRLSLTGIFAMTTCCAICAAIPAYHQELRTIELGSRWINVQSPSGNYEVGFDASIRVRCRSWMEAKIQLKPSEATGRLQEVLAQSPIELNSISRETIQPFVERTVRSELSELKPIEVVINRILAAPISSADRPQPR